MRSPVSQTTPKTSLTDKALIPIAHSGNNCLAEEGKTKADRSFTVYNKPSRTMTENNEQTMNWRRISSNMGRTNKNKTE